MLHSLQLSHTISGFAIIALALGGCVASGDAGTDESSAASASTQAGHEGPRCRELRVIIRDASAPDGCASPNHFCAAGTVEGNLGLHGTTYFVLDGVVAPPANAPGFNMTTGVLVYTVPSGTLTVRETGVGHLVGAPSNGPLTSIEEVVSGTGRYDGATGTLWNNAVDTDSQFTSHIHGQLCLPHGDGDADAD